MCVYCAFYLFIYFVLQFYEELVLGKDSDGKPAVPSKPLNKKIKFSYSYSDEEEDEEDEEEDEEREENSAATSKEGDASNEKAESEKLDPNEKDDSPENGKEGEPSDDKEVDKTHEGQENASEEPPAKKQCLERDVPKVTPDKVEEKSVDKLIEAEVRELADKSKVSLQKLMDRISW